MYNAPVGCKNRYNFEIRISIKFIISYFTHYVK